MAATPKPSPTPRAPSPLLSAAPMMDRTDRHFRYFLRGITRRTLLYTEMVTTGAVLHGDRERVLGFSEEEKPVAVQFGGDDPREMAACARIAEDMGYDEVNINVGCPSERVQKGRFGARLMAEPEVVAACVAAMRAAVAIPVTVKHRIGIDHIDRYEDMARFVEIVAASGCDRFSVHARKAWLQGLSPKENRTVPPLRHEEVYRLKEEFPYLQIETNGGILDSPAIREHLRHVDAVMLGRAAYDNPYLFATVDQAVFHQTTPTPTRRQIVERMVPYAEAQGRRGVALKHITRHLLGLFAGCRGTRAFKRHLAENAHLPDARPGLLLEALQGVPEAVLDGALH
jgi:tRNA-dihydrouridine synthase A